MPLPHRLFAPLFLSLSAAAFSMDQPKGPTSSFLKSHADDKIEWLPWGDAAFAKAAADHKPIYLHIGAYTSELSRAMQTQSFGNAKVFQSLNQNYVCVLIDRDVQPDVAALFQAYLRSEKQLSGWPANLWLTPDLKPFEGATYLPPSEEWGKEGILNVLDRLTPSWTNTRDSLVQRANEAAISTKASEPAEKGPDFVDPKVKEALVAARGSWLERHKTANTVLDDATGHLDPEQLRWLLLQPDESRKSGLEILTSLNSGPLHDPLDGGFFHRGMNANADFPSFQKILSDQARLALTYLEAAKISPDPSYSLGARAALDYVLTNLVRADGGAIHAEDATPEDRLTSFAWTKAQIDEALGAKEGADFAQTYQVKAEGNIAADNDPSGKWKGKNLLSGAFTADAIAKDKTFATDRGKLLAVRNHRPAPLRDENVLIGENGLFLAALSRAAAQLHEPRYVEAAKKCAGFLQGQAANSSDHQLLHVTGNTTRATAEDYSDLALGFSEFAALGSAENAKKIAEGFLAAEEKNLFDAKSGHFYAQYANEPHLWLRTHTPDPLPGETSPAETETVLAHLALGHGAKEIPAALLSTLAAALADPNGTPRGDALLAAALLVQP